MNLAARIFARTAVVALVAISAAFFAGCGKMNDAGDKREAGDKKEAADNGKEDLRKGLEAVKEKKLDEAFKYFEKAANNGNTDAMICLAFCDYEGKSVADKAKAKELIKKAADAGNVKAKFYVLYFDANVDRKMKKEEAFEEMKKLDAELLKLAEANDPLAQVTYIEFCKLRVEMEESPEAKAKATEDLEKWMRKAEETGADKIFD